MKKLKTVAALLMGAAILLTGCEKAAKKAFKPDITGKAGEVLVVMNDKLKNDTVGALLHHMLDDNYAGLPTDEPIFEMHTVAPPFFDYSMHKLRNLVVVNVADTVTTDTLAFCKDVWAQPQSVIYVNAANADGAAAVLRRNHIRVISFFVKAERDRLIALHVKSVEKHVKELAAKDYGSVVDGAIGFVLMFIPNESSYIAAMRRKPSLSRDAYSRKVIIISPSNLLMALQLAYNLWQYDRQNKNVAAIVDQARKLYEKMATFQGTYEDIRKKLRSLTESVEKGDNQLQSGQGNMIGMTEKLRNMGVTPTKLLKQG